MSHPVAFDAVAHEVAEFGRLAILVSIGEESKPHVVTAMIDLGDERLTAEVGGRTGANLRLRPSLSLVWEPTDGGEYQLILDGTAEHVGTADDRGISTVTISVDGGILHRLAGLPDGAPTCRALGEPAGG